MIVGLTGGIASGKSEVSSALRGKNIKVVDADIVAKEIRDKADVKKEILEKISDISDENKEISIEKLRRKVFEDRCELEKLNGIILPKVRRYFEKVGKNIKKDEIVVFDIPLLFENNMDDLCDEILVVVTDERNQIERIVKRNKKIDRKLAKKIIDSQMSSSEKIGRSHKVIYNNKGLDDLLREVEVYYEGLCKRVGNLA